MTTFDWAPLRNALAACRAANAMPRIWWRDDDAVEPTTELDLLAEMSANTGIKVHLAVIPAHATTALAKYCQMAPFVPVVHGWAHKDHSGPDEKKNEFLTARGTATTDASRGLKTMQALFGDTLAPMFVPPWNRISADVTASLADMGYTTLSTYGPRKATHAPPNLRCINTHVDPIWWKGTRDLIDPDTLIATTANTLHQRARRETDPNEPLGLLTHHLVHTPAIWAFTRAFLAEMTDAGATAWSMETQNEQT